MAVVQCRLVGWIEADEPKMQRLSSNRVRVMDRSLPHLCKVHFQRELAHAREQFFRPETIPARNRHERNRIYPGKAHRSAKTSTARTRTYRPKGRSTKSRANSGVWGPGCQGESGLAPAEGAGTSLQLCVLCFGFFQDGEVGVGVFPEGEEVLVGVLGFASISR